MKKFLGIDETPPQLDRSFQAAKKLQDEIPSSKEIEEISLNELPSMVEKLHIVTRQASTNTDLDMREFLGIDKALQRIQGELTNNVSKLSEIDRYIKHETAKRDEMANSTEYTQEQRDKVDKQLRNLKDERAA